MNVPAPAAERPADALQSEPELGVLFHRLNNQLGIILAQAEVLESKAVDAVNRGRATEMVTRTLDAMATARQIRARADSIAL